MNCKYKKAGNERVCSPLHGECQFITCGYGSSCPIFHMLEVWRQVEEIEEELRLLTGEHDEGLYVSDEDEMNLIKEEYNGN